MHCRYWIVTRKKGDTSEYIKEWSKAVVAKALPAGKTMPAKTFFDARFKFLENLSSQKASSF